MAGDKAEHSDGDILRLGGEKHFLNHIGVGVSPVRMQNAGVDSETDTVAVVLTMLCGGNSLVENRGIQLVIPDCFGAVDAPGDDRLVVRFNGEQITDICAFCKQHKKGVGQAGEEIHEHRREVRNVVESERIEHFAHIERNASCIVADEFCYLTQHCVVIDVDFDEGVVFAIYEREIAVCAAIGTAVGDGNEFVVGAAEDMRAEFPIESVDERGCLANHQGLLAFENALAGREVGQRSEPLVVDDFDRRGWEQVHYAAGFRKLGYFSPEQNRLRRKCFGSIQMLFSRTVLF